jgi:hypothetical protein
MASVRVVRALDILSNIATIGAAVAVVAVCWVRFHPTRPDQNVIQGGIGIKTGARVPIEGVDWNRGKTTVVLVLSTHCQFCTQSIPFYREISARRQPNGLRVVAVFPEDAEKGRSFLSQQGLQVDEVVQTPFYKIGVKGTPTLLLVDAAGMLTRGWLGKLSSSGEREILQALP